MKIRTVLTSAAVSASTLLLPAQGAIAAEPAASAARPATAGSALERAQAIVQKGEDFLQAQQAPDGGWQAENAPPAISAVVLQGLVSGERYNAKTPFVRKGYDKLLSYQLEDGGIYKNLQANYNTSIAISALSEAKEPEFKPRIDKAIAYLRSLQFMRGGTGPNGEKIEAGGERENWIGGAGYGGGRRPDTSNTQVYLEALHDAGVKEGDPAFEAAIKFLSRAQNRSESNDQTWSSDDGGFVYTPANGGSSVAGEFKSPDGRRMLRSYGSMTYAGLKSMIYAGLTKDDPRVKAAWDWVTKNWTLDENPGMAEGNPEQRRFGLYYYYLVLAKAHDAYDQPAFTGPDGQKHDWRVELITKAAELQKPDGSFVGEKRFMEDNPVLVTGFMLQALNEAIRDLKEHPAAQAESASR